MPVFSKMQLYCNVCGVSFSEVITNIIGRECKVCSMECMREYNLKRAHSIIGTEYIKENK